METLSPSGAASIDPRRIISLAHPLSSAMPIPGHASFSYEVVSPHRDGVGIPGADPRISDATDRVTIGLHTGTHIDSLTHVAYDGLTHDGTDVRAQGAETSEGIETAGGNSLRPIISRGLLLDFTKLLDVPVIPDDFVIDAPALEACASAAGVKVEPGDTVLIRTGWDTLWSDPDRYLRPASPGPNLSGAGWLIDRNVVATGSDTMVYELMGAGSRPMDVHADLLVRGGIFLLENLDLRAISEVNGGAFTFIAVPLRLDRATGSPIQPVAVIP